MMISYKDIGNRIQRYRLFVGLTQSDVAEKLSVTDKYISQIECGKAKISLNRLFEIARIIKTKPEILIADTEPESPDYLLAEIREKIKDFSPSKKRTVLEMLDLLSKNEMSS